MAHAIELNFTANQINEKLGQIPTVASTLGTPDTTIVCLGDSIFAKSIDGETVVTQIADRITGTVINGAFGGTRMSIRNYNSSGYEKFDFQALATAIATNDYSIQEQEIAEHSLSTLYAETLQLLKDVDFNNVDIILLNYGTNDWSSNTTCVAYQEAMVAGISTILQAYPHIRFVAVTPTWRCKIVDGAVTQDSDTETNTQDNTLVDIIQSMKEVAEHGLHIPVIDCYNIGINIYNFSYYFDGTDGVHQNIRGKELIAKRIVSELY